MPCSARTREVHSTPFHTTQLPKKSVEDWKECHFISAEEMIRGISATEFLEFDGYGSNLFITKFEPVYPIHKQDKIVILDISPRP